MCISTFKDNVEFQGSIGVGTPTPSNNLHVVGTSKIEGVATFNNDVTISKDGDATFTVETSANSGDDSLIKIRGARTNCNTCDIAMLQFDNKTNASYTMAQISAMDPSGSHTQGKGKLVFRTATGGTLSDQMVIDEDGLVGIGTDNPLSALEVRNESGTNPLLTLSHSIYDLEGEVIRIGRTDNTIRYHSIKAMHGGDATNNYIAFHLHDGSGSPHTQQAEVLRLVGNGSVGIGTNNPTGVNLSLIHISEPTRPY